MENFAARRVGIWAERKQEREKPRMTKGFIQIDCQDVLFSAAPDALPSALMCV